MSRDGRIKKMRSVSDGNYSALKRRGSLTRAAWTGLEDAVENQPDMRRQLPYDST